MPYMTQLICIQIMLLLILVLHSHENGLIIKELQEIKVEISK